MKIGTDSQYGSIEERNVITRTEQYAAKKHAEISELHMIVLFPMEQECILRTYHLKKYQNMSHYSIVRSFRCYCILIILILSSCSSPSGSGSSEEVKSLTVFYRGTNPYGILREVQTIEDVIESAQSKSITTRDSAICNLFNDRIKNSRKHCLEYVILPRDIVIEECEQELREKMPCDTVSTNDVEFVVVAHRQFSCDTLGISRDLGSPIQIGNDGFYDTVLLYETIKIVAKADSCWKNSMLTSVFVPEEIKSVCSCYTGIINEK